MLCRQIATQKIAIFGSKRNSCNARKQSTLLQPSPDVVIACPQVTNAKFKNIKIAGSDWTDVVLRRDVQQQLCKIASGTNPITGLDTRETLICS
ncbi:hypothetical protein WJX75_008708 [Coccomyxa subellipsoidea]|uniref:Uncharacterized protein n=1 Tax=Coccomyxa subellipsoidea TaxID=248742 RepID=A0ABR2YQK0_9CHLO